MSELVGEVENNPLNDTWILYAHLPHDTDWSINSYKKILKISTAEQIISVCESLPEPMGQNCMLFLMRENIKPIWEDENNKDGGCFSYKINNKNVSDIWKKLSCLLVGESLINERMSLKINGITISPKKHFCIIKIWMKDCTIQNPDVINYFEGITAQGSLFKKHFPY
jgi:translation initiation factor 4E